MEKESVKTVYEQLNKKYSLPAFEKLDNEFEVSSIENKQFLLKEIRRKITDKIEAYAKILEALLQPDTASVSSMRECRFIEDKEKEEIYTLYKKLMIIDRSSIIASLGDDRQAADFIKNSFEEWNKLKSDIMPIAEKLKSSWENEKDIKEELEYFG